MFAYIVQVVATSGRCNAQMKCLTGECGANFRLKSTGCVGPNRLTLNVYMLSLTISRFKTISFLLKRLNFKIHHEPIVQRYDFKSSENYAKHSIYRIQKKPKKSIRVYLYTLTQKRFNQNVICSYSFDFIKRTTKKNV